jgi:hypothetical protein
MSHLRSINGRPFLDSISLLSEIMPSVSESFIPAHPLLALILCAIVCRELLCCSQRDYAILTGINSRCTSSVPCLGYLQGLPAGNPNASHGCSWTNRGHRTTTRGPEGPKPPRTFRGWPPRLRPGVLAVSGCNNPAKRVSSEFNLRHCRPRSYFPQRLS